jgi:hypothetical protein
MERYRAFQVLEPLAKTQGPGFIFSNFAPGLPDQTLSVADHSFNTAENPDLPFEKAHWAALLINANYQPFLKKRFPNGKAVFLSRDAENPDGGQMLWVMPVGEKERVAVAGWKKANDSYICFPGRYTRILRDDLVQVHSSFQGDPLLESCYAEKLSDLEFRVGQFKDLKTPADALESGLTQGYPAAHIYYKLGVFHLLDSQKKKALGDFRHAQAAPLDLTKAKDLILENQYRY